MREFGLFAFIVRVCLCYLLVYLSFERQKPKRKVTFVIQAFVYAYRNILPFHSHTANEKTTTKITQCKLMCVIRNIKTNERAHKLPRVARAICTKYTHIRWYNITEQNHKLQFVTHKTNIRKCDAPLCELAIAKQPPWTEQIKPEKLFKKKKKQKRKTWFFAVLQSINFKIFLHTNTKNQENITIS